MGNFHIILLRYPTDLCVYYTSFEHMYNYFSTG